MSNNNHLQWLNPFKSDLLRYCMYGLLYFKLVLVNSKWVIGLTKRVVDPQLLSQVIDPNTKLYISFPTQTRQKLPVKSQGSNKVGTVSDPSSSASTKEESYITSRGTCKPILILPKGFGFEYGQ